MAKSCTFNEKSRTKHSRIPISSFMKSRVPIQSTLTAIVRDQDNQFYSQQVRTAIDNGNIGKFNKIPNNLYATKNTQNLDFRKKLDIENQKLMRTIATWEEYKRNLSEPLFSSEVELIISQVRCLMAKFGKFRKIINYWEEGKSDLIDLEEHWKILSFEKDLCYTGIRKLEILKLCHNVEETPDYVPRKINPEASYSEDNCTGNAVKKGRSKLRRTKKPDAANDFHEKENKPSNSISKTNIERFENNNTFKRSPIKTRSKASCSGIQQIQDLQNSSTTVLCNCGQKLKTKNVSFAPVDLKKEANGKKIANPSKKTIKAN